MVFMHECHEPAGHVVVCQACGEDVTADNIYAEVGPGFRTGSKTRIQSTSISAG
ncbi:hypothetical protein [Mycolicibacterium mengxianglii]|uniref:hypothetical protein n=1 Tax=Mycolicibacterium mengxianglii TaxID=2736649 RepID=UPI001E526C09|nr:hypothetical protein [Mycolicibacterium mengxianglii]